MRNHRRVAAIGLLLLLSACTGATEIAVRPQPGTLAPGQQTASFRVAEARSYFRLGSIGLAAEGFRRALREEPASVDALNGLAACYDKMGRFDLSRSYYERALALAPGDARLYANLATSLALQGKTAEASAVRAELATRLGAASAQTASLGAPVKSASPAAATAPPAPRVSLALAEPQPRSGAHIERIGLGEVLLVTRRDAPSVAPLRTAVAQGSAGGAGITVLNGARVARLAADTRSRLAQLGWTQVAIGNAPAVRDLSEVAYPQSRQDEARRLARQLGISLRQQRGAGEQRLVITLGRDIVGRRTRA